MKTYAKVKAVTEQFVTLEFHKSVPKAGTTVRVQWGRARTQDQNALYWVMLTWLIEQGGMKEQGYTFPEELHEALKNRLLYSKHTKGFTTFTVKSTTDLTVDEFMDYIDKCEKLLVEYCGVDMTPFWVEYGNDYAKVNE